MQHIHIYFLPGAAGNFLARAIGLSDGVYAFQKTKGIHAETLSEKMEMYSYKTHVPGGRSIHNYVEEYNWWTTMEAQLVPYSQADQTPTEKNRIITIGHTPLPPDPTRTDILLANDDARWQSLNALYKNSKVYDEYNEISSLPALTVNCSALRTIDGFWEMYYELFRALDIPESAVNQDDVIRLWCEWADTSLMSDAQLDEFEEIYNKHMTLHK